MKIKKNNFLSKEENQNLDIKCWFCKKNNFLSKYEIQKFQKIKDQLFVFIKCLNCNNFFYFWKNLLTNTFTFIRKLHIVLCQPEIPGNVGTIIRLSAAFDFQLHLIEPFGFIFSEKWLKRSSANHFKLANIKVYSDWNDFCQKNQDSYFVLTSSKAKSNLFNFDFSKITSPIFLIFGPESKGLNKDLKKKYLNQTLNISQSNKVSSINLANAVSIFSSFVLFQYKGLNLR